MDHQPPTILMTGASGYVGSELLARLGRGPEKIRCLTRNETSIKPRPQSAEIVEGNVLDRPSLDRALNGIDTAYYLVHLMSDSADFEQEDRCAAENFAEAARQQGVRRIIYLGGLGDDTDPHLSPHLRSRHEVGEILRNSGVETIEFRSSMIIGSGSLSYGLLKDLTDRLPVMICPKWLSTPTQPIYVGDLMEYLLAARNLPPGESRIFEIGGPDVVTFKGLIRTYARLHRQTRVLIDVPLLTPYFSGLWLAVVTPSRSKVGRHLIQGLINPTVVRKPDAQSAFAVRPIGVEEALRRTVEAEQAKSA